MVTYTVLVVVLVDPVSGKQCRTYKVSEGPKVLSHDEANLLKDFFDKYPKYFRDAKLMPQEQEDVILPEPDEIESDESWQIQNLDVPQAVQDDLYNYIPEGIYGYTIEFIRRMVDNPNFGIEL